MGTSEGRDPTSWEGREGYLGYLRYLWGGSTVTVYLTSPKVDPHHQPVCLVFCFGSSTRSQSFTYLFVLVSKQTYVIYTVFQFHQTHHTKSVFSKKASEALVGRSEKLHGLKKPMEPLYSSLNFGRWSAKGSMRLALSISPTEVVASSLDSCTFLHCLLLWHSSLTPRRPRPFFCQ